MKVTWSWLADWVDLPGNPLEIAHGLAMRGLPVQSIERGRSYDPAIVVGEVLSVLPHPNADRLRLCEVDIGTARLSVVCGASNVAAGQRVAVAQVGARLPDGTKLRRSKIRGVESEGMICSERELGLSEESQGIWVLPGDPPIGSRLEDALAGDPVVDVEVTPNRSDCLSVRGLAREIASLRGGSLRPPAPLPKGTPGAPPEVRIEEPQDCPRYMARVVQNIRVGPSPEWLRRRLEASGLRSINNVVDATNYVLRTHGQPIHAFDAARVRGRRIVVRRARAGESLVLLDARVVTLDPSVLVIADAEGPMALAGIMGGLESGVTDSTSTVILESAQFDPDLTRRAAEGLKLATDASEQFAQGVDPDGVALALDDVARLLAEVAGGSILESRVDLWPGRSPRPSVQLRLDRVAALLGIDIDPDRVAAALESLGLRQAAPWSQDGRMGAASFEIPGHRMDLTAEVDLIEEVARVVGYDSIPPTMGRVALSGPTKRSSDESITRIVKAACGLGFDEVLNTALIGSLPEGWGETDAPGPLWEVQNPKSRELRHLRPAILPGLVDAAARNLRHGATDVRLAEIGKIFSPDPPPLGSERLELVLVLGGSADRWNEPGAETDRYLELKGAVESLLGALGIDSTETRSYHGPCWVEGTGARMFHGDTALARIGEVAGGLRSQLGADRRLWAAILDAGLLEAAQAGSRRYRGVRRHPALKRDLALVVGREVAHADLAAAVRAAGGDLLETARLFDLFEGDQVGAGRKSVAFALEFRAPDRTLSDREVDEAMARILDHVSSRFGATWRGGEGVPLDSRTSTA